jgi:hypothetical protein
MVLIALPLGFLERDVQPGGEIVQLPQYDSAAFLSLVGQRR